MHKNLLLTFSLMFTWVVNADHVNGDTISIPNCQIAVTIDGDLTEWKDHAHTDGLWDLPRLQQSPWFNSKRNRLTDHGESASDVEDLSARYYVAWDSTYLYLGAEVWDNVNDVEESRHAPKRWYYKDAIAWFIEAPLDTNPEKFGAGNHGFAFIADSTRPGYAAWWRHGTPDSTYIEEPLHSNVAEYQIRFTNQESGDFVLEARVNMAQTLGRSDPAWKSPAIGDVYRLMIVHCDPDGAEYGGHFLIYGKGDNDTSWYPAVLSPSRTPILRKVK